MANLNLKRLAQDVRIRSLVQKHVEALSHEIATELTQPLLDELGLTREDVGIPTAPLPSAVAESVAPKGLLYDKRSRLWICPRCERFSSMIRRSVSTHARFCTAEPPAKKTRKASTKPRTRRQPKKKP